ncbi:armadillo-like helical domain containing protein 1 [Dysidea avara]|uniref:armadillo-like helical domain containing protein 1 n=1 Tax=Dysidea avara TaxID=196820 RepID=UPI00332740F3
MCSNQEELKQLLQRWDKGSKTVRAEILTQFISQCINMTSSELERHFADCASLFLARITTWIRITYMMGTCLNLQLRAISVFISSASGHRFLTEFLEVGGILTLLEIVGLIQTAEEDKMAALELLSQITVAGRRYKELLCESYAVKVVAECLGRSQSIATQDVARQLLHQLAVGNPRYQSQVYKALVALLPCSSEEAQRMAAHTLREVQPIIGVASATAVEPSLQLLRSLHVDVQQEACQLLKDLVMHEEVRHPLLIGLVGLLKPSVDDSTVQAGNRSTTLPVHVQQAGAAHVIQQLVVMGTNEITDMLIEMSVVPHLLYAMGNTAHSNSQRQASLALKTLLETDTADNSKVRSQVEAIVGDEMCEMILTDVDKVCDHITMAQLDMLTSCLSSESS